MTDGGKRGEGSQAARAGETPREGETVREGDLAREGSYRYFENRACEYYPCHAIARVNCLFCFCPLFHLEDCGGDWTLTDKGVKDCSACARPHVDGGYDFVLSRLS